MKKFRMSVAVTGYVEVFVNADNLEEAEEIANDRVSEMDFGLLSDIDWEVNETGSYDMGPAGNLDDVPVAWQMTEEDWRDRFIPESDLIGSLYIGSYCAEIFATNPDLPQDDGAQDHSPIDVYVYGVPGYSTWDDGTEYEFADEIVFEVPYECETFDCFKKECESRLRDVILKAAPTGMIPDPVALARQPLAPWAYLALKKTEAHNA